MISRLIQVDLIIWLTKIIYIANERRNDPKLTDFIVDKIIEHNKGDFDENKNSVIYHFYDNSA